MKMPKFGTKNALFGYFGAGILKKTIVIFEISTLEFFFHKKMNMSKSGTKNALLGYFWAGV